jgi:3-oxoacyl-[acyl-carrier-protein] synthase-3
VCTQNPDCNLPHTSAIIHGKFDLPDSCAAFDISLGCSGFVYGLAIIESFMRNSEMSNGIFITADPYSKIVDESDKNTSLLFGDASTATYIGKNPTFISGKYTFGTLGKNYASLICNNNTLSMNGRNVFNFLAEKIPTDIAKVLRINNLTLEDIDLFLLHQGSKYIIDFLIQKTPLPKDKTPFAIENYGNTVSSSIPLMLSDFIKNNSTRKILMSGFGVGLSWASGILIRVKEGE